ncbi:MAG TPA: hypothetical protein VMK65_00570 [Longimicrobiales bacterium]|nr:hypothetical protein [Longimicrobiales bacterium]
MPQRGEEHAIREAHVVVRRTARYALLGQAGPEVREVWIALHGYRQLARRFLRPWSALASPTRLIVAPEALSRFYLDGDGGPHGPDAAVGATWMTREDRLTEIGDYVGYLDTLCHHVLRGLERGRVRLRALGFSQGAATVSRWAALGQVEVDELILWSAGFPPDMPWQEGLPRLRNIPLSIVVGEKDAWLTAERVAEQVRALEARGLSPRLLRYAGGHAMTEAALLEVAGPLPG